MIADQTQVGSTATSRIAPSRSRGPAEPWSPHLSPRAGRITPEHDDVQEVRVFLVFGTSALHSSVDLRVEDGRIVIERVARPARAGWAQDAQRLAQEQDDALAWPEFGNADDETLKW